MNLRDLEYILALAEAGSFGGAATRCRVTQPTLSTQVAKLESELGVQLFERASKRVAPTTVGRSIIEQASVVIDEARRLREIARVAEDPLAGPFHLGVIATAGPYLMPYLLPFFKQHHPRLELYVREDLTHRLLQRLHTLDLDAAILSPPIDDRSLATATIVFEEFVAALPPGHPLAARERLDEEDLAAERLLLLEEGHCLRDQTLLLCDRVRNRSHVEFQTSSIESLRQMVAAGIGCSLLPIFATVGPFAEGSCVVLRRFTPPAPGRELVLAWRRSSPHNDVLRSLAETLQRMVDWRAVVG